MPPHCPEDGRPGAQKVLAPGALGDQSIPQLGPHSPRLRRRECGTFLTPGCALQEAEVGGRGAVAQF